LDTDREYLNNLVLDLQQKVSAMEVES
jgi:hypothetical protein